MATLTNTIIDDTGFIKLSSGTSAERPGSPTRGMLRYNTSLAVTEYYNGTSWINATTGKSLTLGTTSASAARSIQELIDAGYTGKGSYFIDTPNGGIKEVYCDFDTQAENGTSGWVLVGSWATDYNWGVNSTSTASALGTTAANAFSSNFGDTFINYFRITANSSINTALGKSATADWYYYWKKPIPWWQVWAENPGTTQHWVTTDQGPPSPINNGAGAHPRVCLKKFDWAYNIKFSYRSSQRYNSLSDAGDAKNQTWPDWKLGLTTPGTTLGVYSYANTSAGAALDGTLAIGPRDDVRPTQSQNTYAHDCSQQNTKVGWDDNIQCNFYGKRGDWYGGQTNGDGTTGAFTATSLWFWIKADAFDQRNSRVNSFYYVPNSGSSL
jgi:hypothetical protein